MKQQMISNTQPMNIEESNKIDSKRNSKEAYLTPGIKNSLEYFKRALITTMYKEAKPSDFILTNSNLKKGINAFDSTINLNKDNTFKKFNIYNDQNVYNKFIGIPELYSSEEDYSTKKKLINDGQQKCYSDIFEAINLFKNNNKICDHDKKEDNQIDEEIKDNQKKQEENIDINLDETSYSIKNRLDDYKTQTNGNYQTNDKTIFDLDDDFW